MLNKDDIVLDLKAMLGETQFLSEVKAVNIYENGKPTGEVEYRYDIAIGEKAKHIMVKIPGRKLAETPVGLVPVKLINLSYKLYASNNQICMSWEATDLKLVKE